MSDVTFLYAPEAQHRGGGAELRARALARELATHFSVEMIAVGSDGDIVARPDSAARARAMVQGVPPRFSQRYDPRVRDEVRQRVAGTKVVIAETLFALPYVLGVDLPVVLDAHNVESEVVSRLAQRHPSRWRRHAYAWTSAWARRWELGAAGNAAQVWAVSEQEARWFRAACGDVVVIPNGVDIPDEPPPLSRDASLIFVGSLHAQFNRDGLAWFLHHCWPGIRAGSPTAVLHVVGAGAEDFRGDGIVAHGFVPRLEDVYRLARVAIIPLQDGAGTRLKALEAMAYSRPIVSTTIGVEGIDLIPERDALVADDAAAFVDACTWLLDDDAEALHLGGSGRDLVCARHDWRDIGNQAAPALSRLL